MSGASPLVIVVDDDDDTREAMRDLLVDEGYEVETFGEAESALVRLAAVPAPGIVLIDLMMPGLDGRGLIEAIESSPAIPTFPVVLMTASSPAAETSALPYPLLRKPVSGDHLLRIIAEFCPRLWDESEPPTDEDSSVRTLDELGAKTARDRCVTCLGKASTRCSGCGDTFCRRCLDAGPDGCCARCWRRAHP